MPLFIANQACVFACSVIGGMLMAFIYDLFRIKRKAVKTGILFIYIEDILYWMIAAPVVFLVIYLSNDGEIRGYIILGIALGAVLYIILLSKAIIKASLFILRIVSIIFYWLWRVIGWPLRLIFRILAVLTGYFFKLGRKVLRKARKSGKNRLYRIKLWRRILKNRRKKI